MVLSKQLTSARALLGWHAEDLASAAGIGVADVERLEAGVGALPMNTPMLPQILAAFERYGVILFAGGSNGGGPGVRFKAGESEKVYTDDADTVQYKEYLTNDAPPGAVG